MHPIVAHRGRLALYLTVWVAFGALLAAVIAFDAGAPLRSALIFAEPLAVLLGLQTLWCWYLVRTLPAGETPLLRLASTWLAVGAASLGIWVAAAIGWAWLLRAVAGSQFPPADITPLMPLLLFAGSIGLTVSVLGHYTAAEFERSRQAERDALELRVAAREAELRFLRGQLDP